jgi:hypothetical protein
MNIEQTKEQLVFLIKGKDLFNIDLNIYEMVWLDVSMKESKYVSEEQAKEIYASFAFRGLLKVYGKTHEKSSDILRSFNERRLMKISKKQYISELIGFLMK